MRHPLFWTGGGLLLFLLLLCFVGPLLDRAAITTQFNLAQSALAPSPQHLLGTSVMGLDQLGQIMEGGRLPIIAGLLTSAATVTLGVAVGLCSGYFGGFTDSLLMRVADMLLSIPQLVPILLVESLFGSSALSLCAVVALTCWPATARIVRTRVLVLRRLPFVEAALAGGAHDLAVIRRHVLPNALDEIVASSTSQFANVVLVMAIATFLGLGLPPPWNWASMFWANVQYIGDLYWWMIFPSGIAFSALIVSVFLLGEAVRHAFNPQEAMEAD